MNKTQFEQNIVSKLLSRDDQRDQWYVPVRDFNTHTGILILHLSNGDKIETNQVWNLDADGFRAARTTFEDDPKDGGLTTAIKSSHYVPYGLVEYATSVVTNSLPKVSAR